MKIVINNNHIDCRFYNDRYNVIVIDAIVFYLA